MENGKIMKSTETCVTNISANGWNVYFSMILNKVNDLEQDHKEHVTEYTFWHDSNCDQCKANEIDMLNRNITMKEVESVIKNTK